VRCSDGGPFAPYYRTLVVRSDPVLAELSRRDLVPAIWLPTPSVRAQRERARWLLHLVRRRTALKNRIHATLLR
jgi:hypothetical protein